MSVTTFAVALAVAAPLPMAFAQSDPITAIDANNTASGGMVGWTWPDARRTSWDIIWSCLSVFLVCSWKCVHLNVPTPEESRGGWHSFRLFGSERWQVPCFPKAPLRRKWARKIKWMAIICVAPEVGVALAVQQWLVAREWLKRHDMKAPEYTIAHAFYANMGGIVLRTVWEPPESVENKTSDTNPKDRVAVLGDLLLPGIQTPITEEYIKDRSKSDDFTKVFAVFQSSWLVIQSVARVAQGLAITELELATIAFVFCAIIMYGFWWHKPYGIDERQTIVLVLRPPDTEPAYPESLKVRASEDEPETLRYRLGAWQPASSRAGWSAPGRDGLNGRYADMTFWHVMELAVINDAMNLRWFNPDAWPGLALYLTGTVFSAIHLGAWHWEFPSPLIQALWRGFGSAAIFASLFPFAVYVLWTMSHLVGISQSAIDVLMGLLGLGMVACYVVSRLAIIFLTFYCFYSMPASAYEKLEWTGFIPHLS